MEKNNSNTWWLWACRIVVGVLFIFSGLIKINDPLGFSYKLDEYFDVFHTPFFKSFSIVIAVSLCMLEIIFGFAILIGIRAVKVAWGLLLLVVFFGFLTFYSAYFNVVQTCGCFGDAIPLTPWQSFSKDMFLLVLVVILFINRKKIQPLFTAQAGNYLLTSAIVVSLCMGLYTYNFLPIIDFLPYKVGANIPDEMKTPPGAQPDEYEQTFRLKNKKTGAVKDMNKSDYLKSDIWKDNDWTVVSTIDSHLIKRGFTPKIKDLEILDAQGNNLTNDIITNPNNNLIIVAYDLSATDEGAINKINTLAINLSQNFNTRTILLTSNSASDADAFSKQHKLLCEVFFADEVPLKSMVRSNPGLFLLKKGTIINKWHYHSLPTYDELVKKYFQE